MASLAQHLRRDRVDSLVLLEDGDPRLIPCDDAIEWDWDTDSVSPGEHCRYCGAAEPLFRLANGGIACGACFHGGGREVPSPSQVALGPARPRFG